MRWGLPVEPILPAGWSHKYNEWVAEADVVRYDKSLLEQSAAAAGNAPGDLTGKKRKVRAVRREAGWLWGVGRPSQLQTRTLQPGCSYSRACRTSPPLALCSSTAARRRT